MYSIFEMKIKLKKKFFALNFYTEYYGIEVNILEN